MSIPSLSRILLAKTRRLSSRPDVDIRIVGRTDHSVGIGVIHRMFAEAARGELVLQDVPIRGRKPFMGRLRPARMAIYTDVLENWKGDGSYKKVRGADLKIACIAFDSDRVPPSWVEILNREFDLVMATSEFVKSALADSGCELPIFVFPLHIPGLSALEPIQNFPKSRLPVRFLSIGAYHPRKNYRQLVQAFLEEFGPHADNVQLNIHSNLGFSDEYEVLRRYIEIANAKNIFATKNEFHPKHISDLFDYSEIYVTPSKGEGFCLPAHEAAVRGKILVVTGGSALEEIKTDRLIHIPVTSKEPARYPEIENKVFGKRCATDIPSIRKALRKAFNLALSSRGKQNAHPVAANGLAAQHELIYRLRTFMRPLEVAKGKENKIEIGKVTSSSTKAVSLISRQAKSDARINKRVIVGHDGGFFSVFNIYVSHLVWGQGAAGIQYVLPDWNVDSIRKFHRLKKFQSFCYGGYKDKNIWGRLFESPYKDVTLADLDDPIELYKNSTGPEHSWNARNEPNLTYIHAEKLYRAPDFQQWRQWYHAYYSKFITPKSHILRRVDELENQLFGNAYVIAAHIRHPSHVIEQPGGGIPEIDHFLFAMEKEVEARQRNQRVKIFIATDQEKVVKQAAKHFGSLAVFVKDAKRVSEQDDGKYEKASKEEKRKEGFQVQHLAAAEEKKWSVKMAEEVMIDALLLSRAKVMFHTVSNVATAVSFMNPAVKMNYLAP